MNERTGQDNASPALGIAVLGATGSIGRSTLRVLELHPEKYRVDALTAYSDVEAMQQLCDKWAPEYAVMGDPEAAQRLTECLKRSGCNTEVLAGADGLLQAATLPSTDLVMAGIVGAAGLIPTLAALQADKRVLLANKEPLVMAGALFMQALKQGRGELIPVDSEHNAVLQCLPSDYRCGRTPENIAQVILTASGGPFCNSSKEAMLAVTPEQAVRHPNWTMGPKISVDSATMMNKGLELIEAAWLFALPADKFSVLVHPQSLVHALVQFEDGSLMAHLGQPDMRVPISAALNWPHRTHSGVSALDLLAHKDLSFSQVDLERFPCVSLALQALRSKGSAALVLNAANEVAVDRFLNKQIGFMDIHRVCEQVMNVLAAEPEPTDLPAVIELDQRVRQQARSLIDSFSRNTAHA